MLLTEEMYNQIWDWVEAELKFRPYYLDRKAADAQGFLPFQIQHPHAVYTRFLRIFVFANMQKLELKY